MYTRFVARLIGLDIGTSGTKAMAIDEQGKVLQSSSRRYEVESPQPGWAEQDPEMWWMAAESCLHELGGPVDAIGLTGQMHGSVFLDQAGQVLRPAILWCDQRTQVQCDEIVEKIGEKALLSVAGNLPLTGFQAPKVLWLREHEPQNYRQVSHVLLPKDYVRYRLTGDFLTDHSDASGTGVFNVFGRRHSPKVLSQLDIDPNWFPRSAESWVKGDMSTAQGVPVVAGAGDQAAGAVGQGSVSEGIVSLSLGTSGVAFSTVDGHTLPENQNVHLFCHAQGGWHVMGVMLAYGAALTWARDTLCPGLSFEQLSDMAFNAEPGARGLTFLPYLSGERCPFASSTIRGGFFGLASTHQTTDLIRAVFEGVSFGLYECLVALGHAAETSRELRVTGGGAACPLLRQLIADLSGKPCVQLDVDEGPAFGAAMLAGVGVGIWPDVRAAAREVVREKAMTDPSSCDHSHAFERYKSASTVLKDLCAQTNTIK